MKNIFFLLFTLLTVCGCNKDTAKMQDSQTLSGSWELRTYTGNRMPDRFYEPGNGNIFVFAEGNYSLLNPDVATKNGTYKLTQAPDPNTGEETSAIKFEGNSLGTVCYSLQGDVLTFYWSPLASCGSLSTYARVADIKSTPHHP